MDQATANVLITTVRAAFAQALAAAQSVSDPDLQKQMVGAMAMVKAAVDDWAGNQLAQVQAGTRTEANWTDYGQNVLLPEITRFVADNGSFYAQYSAALNAAGTAAADVESTIDSAIADAATQLDNYQADLAIFQDDQDQIATAAAALAPYEGQLSAELQDLLWGDSATSAANAIALFSQVLAAVQGMVSDAQAGASYVFQNGDIVPASGSASTPTPDSSVDDSGDFEPGVSDYSPVSGLGVVFWTAAAWTGGVLLGLALLGTIAIWLYSYYNHASQLLQAKEVDDLTKSGLSPDQVVDAINALKKNSGGGSGIPAAGSMFEAALPYLGLLVAALFVLTLTTDVVGNAVSSVTGGFTSTRKALSFKRSKNPRRKRRR